MIFLQILQTFYDHALDILPLFIVGTLVASVALEYFPARTLDFIIKKNIRQEIVAAVFFGVVFPATAGYRIPIAALARRGGAGWAPTLGFIGAGAGAGASTIIVTALLGWQMAALRLVVALIFALVLVLVVSRLMAPRFAAAAMDSDVVPLFSRDFCEGAVEGLETAGSAPSFEGLFNNLLRVVRVTFPWLFLSLFLATLVSVIVSAQSISGLFSGILAVPLAALLGLPFYLVAGADVPLLAVLLEKGMSMGAAVAFMLAAPLINLPVLLTMRRWLGFQRTGAFLGICLLLVIAIGSALELAGFNGF